MPNYTDVLGLYKPTNLDDSFGSTFLPELSNSMEVIENEIVALRGNDDIRVTASGGDDTTAIQNALNESAGKKWVILEGTYNISSAIKLKDAKIYANDAEILASHAAEALWFEGVSRGTYSATGGYTKGLDYILMPNTAGIQQGDLIRFYSTSELFHPSRSYYYKGGSFIVKRVAADRVYISGALPYGITAVTNVEVYNPGHVTIQGKLRIENTGALPNGTFGLRLDRCANFNIDGVTVDNFDTCITPRFCVNGIFSNCHTERAWYSGTGQSYGISTISSRNLLYDNCSTKSGRHGHTGGGWDPLDMIYFRNCNFFAEPESDTYAFDLHDNAFRVQIENCEMDSFTVIGNVTMRNCTVFHAGTKKESSFKSNDEDWKCNYIMENMTFPNGGPVKLTGYAQSGGTWTMDQIGSFVARNWSTGGDTISANLEFKAKDAHVSMPTQNIGAVIFENMINIILLLKDNIKMLHVRNATLMIDAVHLYQYSGMVDTVLIENSKLINKYNGIYFTGFKVAKIMNCNLHVVSGLTSTGVVFNSTTGLVTFDTCDFSSMDRGLTTNAKKLALINTQIPLYANTAVTTVTL